MNEEEMREQLESFGGLIQVLIRYSKTLDNFKEAIAKILLSMTEIAIQLAKVELRLTDLEDRVTEKGG